MEVEHLNIFIVYCHPSDISFTFQVKNEFIRGLKDAGHSYEISDLYKMNFNADFSEREYLREGFYAEEKELDVDVIQEQRKIQNADAIVFIYPLFWTEAPARLVGWFDRVWTCGFAYGNYPKMRLLEKALCIITTGKTLDALKQTGEDQAISTVMLGDRIRNRAKQKDIVFFDGTSRWNMAQRNENIPKHLARAYLIGLNIRGTL